jgi:Uma2 family endonuclease
MNPDASTIANRPIFRPEPLDEDDVYYPDTDETIMTEGILHFWLSVNLASMLKSFYIERSDVQIFGNVMFYYEKGNVKSVVSPDLMICFGLEAMPTRVYRLWEEKIVPSVVIEFASESIWFKDVSTKIALYQKLGVTEYFVFDPEYKNLPQPLIAFRLIDGIFIEQEIKNQRIYCESLELELVDSNETLRLFNPKTNEFLMTPEEMAAELARLRQQN